MKNESLPPLIKSLLVAGIYPSLVESVELVETHASWVLLAGKFAYKIKKPITLPFLDYGTLEKRHACCEEELRLNSRFSPDIYLEVVTIVGTPENPRFGNDTNPIEYAVKMRRFDEATRLDRVCSRGELKPSHISSLINTVFAFHSNATKANLNTNFGSPSDVLAPALENFEELYSLLSNRECLIKLDSLHDWTRNEFNRIEPFLLMRKKEGFIRECHGDLHLGNIVLIDECVKLFDCIEFSEDLRWIDVASDIAFIYIDLLDHHQPSLAGWLLNEWLCRSGDFTGMTVIRFYAVYRALVRAKVAAIRAKQDQGNINEVLDYIMLSEKLSTSEKPQLTITHGLSGCGKTTASKALILKDVNAATLRLRSDVERKRIFGFTALEKSSSSIDAGIYTKEANNIVYHRLYKLAKDLLEHGWSVIVDAAFLKRAERTPFYKLATQLKVEFRILAPQASITLLRDRITDRTKKGYDASEATNEVLERQIELIEPLDSSEVSYLL